MSHRTQRNTLISLLLLTAALSFAGCLIDHIEFARASRAFGTLCRWDYSVPSRDFRVAVALLIGAVALVSRRGTKLLLIPASVLAGVLSLPAIAGLFLDPEREMRWFLEVLLSLVLCAGALYWLQKERRERIALLGVVYALSDYLLWALMEKPDRFRYPSRDSEPLTFFFDHFAQSRAWHPVVLALLFLLLVWVVKQALDEAAARRGTTVLDAASGVRRRGIVLAATVAWTFAVAVFVSRHPITGLVMVMTRVAPNASFDERLLTKVSFWKWYTTPLRDYFSVRNVPDGARIWLSPDRRKAVYISRDVTPGASKQCVMAGDEKGPRFDQVSAITFSPDGSQMGYLARQGKQWFAVVGGRKGPAFEQVRYLTFSRDGRHHAYVAKRNRKEFVVADGQIGPEFDLVFFPHFRCDGKWEYEAERDGRRFKLVEGAPSARCPGYPCGTYFSADCSSSAEVKYLGEKKVIVFAGKAGPEFEHLSFFRFSPDGSKVAYGVSMDHGLQVVLHGKTIESFQGQVPEFSPDGRLTYWTGGALVVDGKAGEVFSGVESPLFSRDGKVFAYRAEVGTRYLVVVGPKKGPTFDRIPHLAISNDGKTVAYTAFQAGRAFVMVNDRKGPEYDWLGGPVINPDGTHVAYRAWRRYREFVVVNHREGPQFDWVSDPVFSPDGTKVAYAARQGREFWWKVMDVR